MQTSVKSLLADAAGGHYAVGGFNVYNLEGARAVLAAAEAARSPVILQVHSTALRFGGLPLLALCLAGVADAAIPAAVHLDHCSALDEIGWVLEQGVRSVMFDGSHLPLAENIAQTRQAADLAHAHGAVLEAELGRLAGTEDGLTIAEYEAKLTDPDDALLFIAQTGVDALAVCIGNVHGIYRTPPHLDFARLEAIRARVAVPLVLHGASGLPAAMLDSAIAGGVCKFNVNTEVRAAYLDVLRLQAAQTPDLLDLLRAAQDAMQRVVHEKLVQFGSSGRAS